MSYLGTDPGDLSPEQMYGREDRDLRLVPCADCHTPEGELDTERMDAEGLCAFGCGRKVDDDTRYCGNCGDHSANVYECPGCDLRYEKWDGTWQVIP